METNDRKVEQGEEWRFMGDNSLQVEVFGPHSNQWKILVGDVDGDWISLLPSEAKRLMKMLQKGIDEIASRRKVKREIIGLRKAG